MLPRQGRPQRTQQHAVPERRDSTKSVSGGLGDEYVGVEGYRDRNEILQKTCGGAGVGKVLSES